PVRVLPRRVGPDECDNGGGEERGAARGLGVDVAPYCAEHTCHAGSPIASNQTPTRLPGTPEASVPPGGATSSRRRRPRSRGGRGTSPVTCRSAREVAAQERVHALPVQL